jgi:dCTP diphosphatase
MSDLSDLQKRVIAFRDARDWKQFHNPKDSAISLVLEAAEVIEHFQWKTEDEIREHLKTHKEDLSGELVDVLYWVLLMAHDLDIDLSQSFDQKMAKNEAKYAVEKSKGNHKKYTELNNE